MNFDNKVFIIILGLLAIFLIYIFPFTTINIFIIIFLIVLIYLIVNLIIEINESDSILRNSIISSYLLKTWLHLLGLFWGFCLINAFLYDNNYAQILSPLVPVIIMISYQHYQKKNEEILFKEVLINYIYEQSKKAIETFELYSKEKIKELDNYLQETREFYYILDPINDDLEKRCHAVSDKDYFNKMNTGNYFYLLYLIRHDANRFQFRASPPKSLCTSEENIFIESYNLIHLLHTNHKGASEIFYDYVDRFIKNKDLFESFEKYRRYALGTSLVDDYEKSIEFINDIILETEKYINKF